MALELAGPVGERNLYFTEPRGTVLCVAPDLAALLRQITAALATGNRAVTASGSLPCIDGLSEWIKEGAAGDAVLFSGEPADLQSLAQSLAASSGPIRLIHIARPDGTYPVEFLVLERSVSTNTAAAGGNANLMMIG